MIKSLYHPQRKMITKPINLVLDWDGTLTRKDTMFSMGKIANARDRRTGRQASSSETWEGLGRAYMDDFAQHQQAYSPKPEDRTSRSQESAWLQSLENVERQSVARVEASGLLCGVKQEDVLRVARDAISSGEVALRPGWQHSMSENENPRLTTSILSVNWSEAFIRAALTEAAKTIEKSGEQPDLPTCVGSLNIVANEISDLESPEGSSGRLSSTTNLGIRTSSDKLRHFIQETDFLNVYVGDSATDFDCLLAADVGICMRDEPLGTGQRGLAEALDRTGYKIRHASELAAQHNIGESEPVLFWAKDFNETMAALNHLESPQTDARPI